MSDPEQLSLGVEVEEPPTDVDRDEHRVSVSATAETASPFPPTAEQTAAIDSRDRDVFLEAGAGTGKTRVLVDRYCDAVDLDGVEPERILAFTFTEKAAAEMRRRVRVELMRRARTAADPERQATLTRAARSGEAAPITTIHGFCRRLLAAHPVAAGLDPQFRVLDADEAGRVSALAFEAALEELAAADDDVARTAAGYRHRLPGLIRAAYSDLRNHGERRPQLPPLQITAFEGAGEDPPSADEIELADAAYGALRRLLDAYSNAYEAAKAERSGVDFDDLQLVALELLEENPRVAESFRERYEHLLVDELQDTSPLQVGLVRALAGPGTRLFTVGDEFQSIYAFRGANLESFRAERARARGGAGSVLPLSGSFRSSPDVVAAVNAIGGCLLEDFRELEIGRAEHERPPGPAGPVVELLLTGSKDWNAEELDEIETAAIETAPNRIAEARFLARRLRQLADEGVAPGSMVLLLRAFTHVDAYAEALELAGLDPYVVGGRGYWSSQQVEDGLRLLACVANPLDDEALLGALASPACGAGPDALWILRRAADRAHGRHIWPAIEDYVLGLREPPAADEPAEDEAWEQGAAWAGKLPGSDRARIETFGRRLVELRIEAPLLPLDALVEATLERFDYDLAALSMPGGKRRAANLLKLVRIAGEFEAHEGRDLRGLLTYAAERASRSDREAEATIAAEDHDGVTIMTVHAAKGLEFDCVAVADLGRKMTAGGAQPELRLAFGESAAEDAAEGEGEQNGPRVGLRLARAGAPALTVAGFQRLSDDAAEADSQESARLTYVAASRARERLLLSGVYEDAELDRSKKLSAASPVLARLLPILGLDAEADEQTARVPTARGRADLPAGTAWADAEVSVRFNRADQGAVETLSFDLREADPETGPPPGGRPPMLALAERGGSAARSLSYAALADYERCGYRFLTERVLGLSVDGPTEGPIGPGAGDLDAPGRESDEEPADPGFEEGVDPGARAMAAIRRSRLGFGRAVHGLLELSARRGWQRPTSVELDAALAAEGADPDAAGRGRSLIEAWLDGPLLAELREAGASFRPEVPFRVELGSDTVLRGTIDLIAQVPGRAPLVIDYKTDSSAPGAGAELGESYRIQRDLYAHAVAEATGAETVASAYVFLADAGRPIQAELDGAAIAAGRERIEALIERIRERRFEVTDAPHAALCHDCPARPRLCPHPRELTLARRPPSGGTLSA